MIELKFYMFFIAALVPMIVGFVWYHPKVLGGIWMNASGMTEEKIQQGNMPLIFGLAYLFSFLIAIMLSSMVIHQFSFFSILADEPGLMEEGTELNKMATDFLAQYGENGRNFGHGAFHGLILGFLFATPLIGVIALFERRTFKYIAVHAGYWIVALTLMGGVIGGFA